MSFSASAIDVAVMDRWTPEPAVTSNLNLDWSDHAHLATPPAAFKLPVGPAKY